MSRMFAPSEPLRAIYREWRAGQFVYYSDIVVALEEPDDSYVQPPMVWTASSLYMDANLDTRITVMVVAAADVERTLHSIVSRTCNQSCRWKIHLVDGHYYETAGTHQDGCRMKDSDE